MKRLVHKILRPHQENAKPIAFAQIALLFLLSLTVCLATLSSFTWGWFNDSVVAATNSVKTTYSDVSVLVVNEGNTVDAIDGKYRLEKGKAYQIEISASGTSETSYCILRINGVDYYTEKIPSSDKIIFSLQFNEDTVDIEIIPCWGTWDWAAELLSDGAIYVDLLPSE